MRKTLLLAALLAIIPAAHAAKAHVHGEGHLDVAIDKDQISIALELPLDAAVGFERAPKNAKEKAALTATDTVLKDAAALFVPTPAANCTLQSMEVQVPFMGGMDQHNHTHESETHHADIDANYVFRCANPAALKGIETTIFKQFKRLYRLETQRAGPMPQGGQGAMRLTPKQPILSW
jgi:hypothetical protein